MKKLTVALVLVGLLTLPIVGLAGGPPNEAPPKGTNNWGLWHALSRIMENDMPYWWSAAILSYLWSMGGPPWFTGK